MENPEGALIIAPEVLYDLEGLFHFDHWAKEWIDISKLNEKGGDRNWRDWKGGDVSDFDRNRYLGFKCKENIKKRGVKS